MSDKNIVLVKVTHPRENWKIQPFLNIKIINQDVSLYDEDVYTKWPLNEFIEKIIENINNICRNNGLPTFTEYDILTFSEDFRKIANHCVQKYTYKIGLR